MGGLGQGFLNAVPGAYYAGQSQLAWQQGRYAMSIALYGGALADAAVGVLTFGQGTLATGAVRSTTIAARGFSLNSSNLAMGVERASPELLSAVQSHGRTITFAAEGSEELRYLNVIGAEANVGGPNLTHILLRGSPSKAALLEEFLHGTQWGLGIVQRLGIAGAEAHVKSFMIRHARMLGLGDEDVAALRQLLDAGL